MLVKHALRTCANPTVLPDARVAVVVVSPEFLHVSSQNQRHQNLIHPVHIRARTTLSELHLPVILVEVAYRESRTEVYRLYGLNNVNRDLVLIESDSDRFKCVKNIEVMRTCEVLTLSIYYISIYTD